MAFPSLPPIAPMPSVAPITMPPPQQGGGMFGGGKFGVAQAIVAALNGYLAGTRGPGQQVGLQNMQMLDAARQRKEQMALAAQQHQQQIQDEIAVHQANRQYDITNAPPPDIVDRINALEAIQPGLGKTYAQNYANNGGGMGPVLINPMTGQTMVPAAKAGVQEPPAEAVARLKSNPTEAQQFDEIFGPGASAKYLGGAGGNASGGFPH